MFLTFGSLNVKFLCSKLDWVGSRQLSLDCLSKLLVIDFGITIEIKSAQNGYNFLFAGKMAHGPEETLQVLFVDVLVVPVINSFESSPDTKVVTGLK